MLLIYNNFCIVFTKDNKTKLLLNQNYSEWYFGLNVTSIQQFQQMYSNQPSLVSDVLKKLQLASSFDILFHSLF